MTFYVYSTMSNPVEYIDWQTVEGGELPQQMRKVKIEGGANVMSKHFITPKGVVTEVSDDDMAFLENHPVFVQQQKAGFITVQKRKVEVEKAVKEMTARDKSAPLQPGRMKYDESNQSYRLA